MKALSCVQVLLVQIHFTHSENLTKQLFVVAQKIKAFYYNANLNLNLRTYLSKILDQHCIEESFSVGIVPRSMKTIIHRHRHPA